MVFNLNAPEGSSQRIEIDGFGKELTLFLHVLTEIWCLKERKNRHRLFARGDRAAAQDQQRLTE